MKTVLLQIRIAIVRIYSLTSSLAVLLPSLGSGASLHMGNQIQRGDQLMWSQGERPEEYRLKAMRLRVGSSSQCSELQV